MTNRDLQEKWLGISDNSETKGFRSLRISAECFCELYIGVDKEGTRCLILLLPSNKKLRFLGVQKENLSIEYSADQNLIILESKDKQFNDLFDDLILSLYHGIKNLKHADAYSDYFIQTFYRWSDFFVDKDSDLLTEEVIKGIFGELLILKLLISTTKNLETNAILKAWSGPYDKRHDFELVDKNLEVKTKSPEGIDVKISSEHQLESPAGKKLELVIVSIANDHIEGLNLEALISEVKKIIQDFAGDVSILWSALNRKNITAKNLCEYSKYRYRPVNWTSYNCDAENFPKLNRSNTPKEISSLQYTLSISSLKAFVLDQNEF